jgi:metacaspase-1
MDYALLVGINDYPYPNKLEGCVNDITDVKAELVGPLNFSGGKIATLHDAQATASNIKTALDDSISQLKDGDRFLFWYSGHGAQLTEGDARTDVICPIDFTFTPATSVTVDDFHRAFAKIPKGVRAAWGSDSCHSGDLEKDVRRKGYPKLFRAEPSVLAKVYTTTPMKFKGFKGISNKLPNIALIAGCHSNETSADALIDGRYNGAFTYYFLKQLKISGALNVSLEKLIPGVREALRSAEYTQVPELSGPPSVVAKPFLVP